MWDLEGVRGPGSSYRMWPRVWAQCNRVTRVHRLHSTVDVEASGLGFGI